MTPFAPFLYGVTLAISPEYEDLVRQEWERTIPAQFKALPPGKEWKAGAAHVQSSLSARIPSSFSKNDKLFDKLDADRHLTAQQRSENKRREAIAAKAAAKKAANIEAHRNRVRIRQRNVRAAAKHSERSASGAI